MKNTEYDIIVIGGGPAGMMAAGRASELGAKVLLLEKNDCLGKKLILTGGRRCNITNAEFNSRIFLENFPKAKQFLYTSFAQFDVKSTFDFFERRGLSLVVEEKKRAFPKSQKAEDVREILIKYIEENGNVEVKFGAALESFILKDKKLVGIKTSNGIYKAKNIILATGGTAAPETGSTGECFEMLRKIGHIVAESNPSLVPLRSPEKWVGELSGLTTDKVKISFVQNGKTKIKNIGSLLFTHFGISGPIVINSAHKVGELLKNGKVLASVDFFPDLDEGELNKMIFELFEKNKNKLCKNVLAEILPKKIVYTIFGFPSFDFEDKKIHSVTKEERKLLVKIFKDLRFPIDGLMGLDWSIVADGGVIPQEINFKTMASKLFPNLYLVGDAINISRPSGGFSLQLCWTTGWIAGGHAASGLK